MFKANILNNNDIIIPANISLPLFYKNKTINGYSSIVALFNTIKILFSAFKIKFKI